MRRLILAFLALLLVPFAAGQVIGVQPTPLGLYQWNSTQAQFNAATNTYGLFPVQTTPQAFAFYGYNSTLHQWVPCDTVTNSCPFLGGGVQYPSGTGVVTVASGAAWGTTLGTQGTGSSVILPSGTPGAGKYIDGATFAWTTLPSIPGSGTVNYFALWTPNGTTLGIGHMDDGGTTPGFITSSETIQAIMSTALGEPFYGINNATSSAVIGAAAFTCPNVATNTINGCSLEIGKDNSSGTDASRVTVQYRYGGSIAANRGALSMSTTGGDPVALEWDFSGNVYLPKFPSIGCLGTDGSGKLGSGSGCGGSAITSLTNDVNATGPGAASATVVGLRGHSLPTPALGYVFYDGTNLSWSGLPAMSVTSATSIALSCGQWIRTTAASTVTITLPTATASMGACQTVIERGGTGTIAIATTTGTYDGASTNLQQDQAMTVVTDGTNWHSSSPIIPGVNCSWTGSLTGNTFNCSGGGTGTVNSGTAGQLAYYASTGTAVSGTNAIPNNTTATTQALGDSSTKVATDAFVLANAGGTSVAPSNAIYNGALSAALNKAINTNGQVFSNNSGCYWQAAPAYGTAAYILDNYYYMSNVPDTVKATCVLAFLNNMVSAVSSGNFPISLTHAGAAGVYVSGCQSDPTTPTGDGAFIMPQMAKLYYMMSGSISWFHSNKAVLETALNNVPTSGTNLVTSASLHPWVDWGFQDAVVKTGDVLMGSLLKWRAAQDLVYLCTIDADATCVSTYTTVASNIAASLGTGSALWDSTDGMFLAATTQNNQIDVFGSAYAVYLGFISGAQQSAISSYLVTNYASLVTNGFVRQSPTAWAVTSSAGGCPQAANPNGYDNGLWAVANKWIYQALKVTSQTQAQQLLVDQASNSDPAQEWYATSGGGTGSSPNIASIAPAVRAADTNYPGAIIEYAPFITQPPGCGSAQALASFYGTNGTLLLNTVDNCLNGWSTWTFDTTSPPAAMTMNGLGQAYANISTGTNAAVINNKAPSSANYTVSGAFTVASNAAYSVQVFARVQGPSISTAYYAICGTNVSSQCQIHKTVSGTDTSLGGTAFSWANGSTHTIAFQVNGTALTLFVDGVSTVTATDSSIGSAGFAGFGIGANSSTTNVLISNWQFQ